MGRDHCLQPLGASMAAGPDRSVEQIIVSVPLDPYLSLKALAAYSGLSVRKLRDQLRHPSRPLPHYRVDGKILVRRSEFDAWIAAYRRVGESDVDRIVDEVLVPLVKKEYPNSVRPPGNLRAKGPAIAMRYWTLNCDEVYLAKLD
jgi:helix-turn-helix protein